VCDLISIQKKPVAGLESVDGNDRLKVTSLEKYSMVITVVVVGFEENEALKCPVIGIADSNPAQTYVRIGTSKKLPDGQVLELVLSFDKIIPKQSKFPNY
jgi:hypothetical protein